MIENDLNILLDTARYNEQQRFIKYIHNLKDPYLKSLLAGERLTHTEQIELELLDEILNHFPSEIAKFNADNLVIDSLPKERIALVEYILNLSYPYQCAMYFEKITPTEQIKLNLLDKLYVGLVGNKDTGVEKKCLY